MITPDTLRAVPLFALLPDETLAQIAALAADMHLIEGEWLMREGETPAFFVLLEGQLEVTKRVAGADQVLTHHQAGDYFGEVPLLLGSPDVANVRATSDAQVLRLDAGDFHTLMEKSDPLAASILQTMTRRVADLQRVSVETPVPRTLIVGHPADLECYDLRQFLSGNHQDFHWLNPDNPLAVPLIPEDLRQEPYPAVVLPGGEVLRNPSKRALAEHLGLQITPRQPAYDVVIIGAGPAGLAAAVYGASEGLRTLLVEREAPGGQAGTSSRIENYLGFPTGISGADLGERALQQAQRFGTEIVVTRSAVTIQEECASAQVVLDGGQVVDTRAIILATGVAWRSLWVPGAEPLVGKGIYYGAARTEAMGVRGKDVFLIGGGNSAGQAAMFFADYAQRVTLLIRASSLERGMSQYLIDQLRTKANISVCLNCSVTAVHGDSHLEAISVCDSQSGIEKRLNTDALFVFIGADAKTDWLPGTIACDDRGYLLTGLDALQSGKWTIKRDPYLLETSVPGVFAAGDVRHGSIKRVASGVGEGSMAIAFVHQYLALDEQPAPPAAEPPAYPTG